MGGHQETGLGPSAETWGCAARGLVSGPVTESHVSFQATKFGSQASQKVTTEASAFRAVKISSSVLSSSRRCLVCPPRGLCLGEGAFLCASLQVLVGQGGEKLLLSGPAGLRAPGQL